MYEIMLIYGRDFEELTQWSNKIFLRIFEFFCAFQIKTSIFAMS